MNSKEGTRMDEQEYEYNQQRLDARRKKRQELKRKRQRQKRIFYAVAVLVVILIIVLVAKGCGGSEDTGDKALTDMTVEELTERAEALGIDLTGIEGKDAIIAAIENYADAQNQPEQEEPDPSLDLVTEAGTATLTAVGDIMVYDTQIADALQSDGSYDFSPCFAGVSDLLSASDLTVGNFEANFCGEPYSGYPDFTAPEALATDLADAGFDILQTANTYSIQNGLTGLTSTIRYISEAGMDAVGTYYVESAKQNNAGVLIKEVNGIKIAFIAYTKGVNNMYLPSGSEYAVDVLYTDYYSNYTQVDSAAILESINAAKSLDADVIVAMVHWGMEYDVEPSSTQEQIATLMFENGVDVILGSHSHIVGPMEMRTVTTVDGEEKEVFLAYSLGNFLSSMSKTDTQDSVILNLEFTKSSDGSTVISDVNYVPIYLNDNGESAENRYTILNTYDEIDRYIGGASDRVSDETYSALQSSLTLLHTNAGLSFDKNATAQ
jgi:poly-gamma-glutamate synthesis protein (capsule biosynthesis protein)